MKKKKGIRVMVVMALFVVLAGSSYYYSIHYNRYAVWLHPDDLEKIVEIIKETDTEIQAVQETETAEEEPEWPKIVYTDFKPKSAFPAENTFCVYNSGEYLFLTQEGKNLTGDTYGKAYPFHEGLACVAKAGKYGYINPKGETAIPFVYDDAAPFMEGLAYFCKDGEYGFMDKTGEPKFYLDCDSVSQFVEGLAYFCIDGRYGYIDTNGDTVIEPDYDDAGYFKDGVAEVVKDSKRGIIDKTGREIVPADYIKIERVESCYLAKKEEKYQVYDRDENFLAGQEFTDWESKGALGNEELGISGILCQGEVYVFDKYYDIRQIIPERKLVVASFEDAFGVIDFAGEIKIPFSYEDIFYNNGGNVFVLEDTDGKCGLLDGGDLATWHVPWDNDYEFIRSQEPGQALFEIQKGDNYGIINGEGETVLEPDDYDTIEILENGAYYVEKQGERTLYKDGKILKKGHFRFFYAGGCYEMYPADPEKNGVTYLDESGKEIVSLKNYSPQTLVHFYYPGIDFLCHMEGDTGDGGYAIVHTKDARDGKLPDCLFVNNITPRASLFLEFLQSGTFEAEDEGGTYTSYCEDWRGYHTVYKFYDFSHTGNPVLYVYASPYNLNGNCSGFFVSQGEGIKKLCSSFNLGARGAVALRISAQLPFYDKKSKK